MSPIGMIVRKGLAGILKYYFVSFYFLINIGLVSPKFISFLSFKEGLFLLFLKKKNRGRYSSVSSLYTRLNYSCVVIVSTAFSSVVGSAVTSSVTSALANTAEFAAA